MGYVFEPKYDGIRLLASRDTEASNVRLYTRTGRDVTADHPYVAKVLGEKKWSGWVDGELVYGDTFQETQNKAGKPTYWVFDKPDHLGDLEARKQSLKYAFRGSRTVKVVPHSSKPFDPCAQGMEGLVAKDPTCRYKPGARSSCWLKYKCKNEQEFVIAGYTEGTGKRKGMVGALLLGYYQDGALRYAGKVGTGMDEVLAASLFGVLKEQEVGSTQFVDGPQKGRWVDPKLVAQVEFMEWTSAGRIRQGSFQGLRDDKPATEIVREQLMTHVTKLLFPNADVDKAGLAKYYAQVADRMVPELVNRPLTLLRCPDGVDKACFFQRNVGPGAVPPGLKVIEVDGTEHYALASAEGLQSLAQLNVAEIHPWTSRGDNNPDRLVFDLDPSDNVDWSQTVRTAGSIRAKLADHGLEAYVKTSGNKGLHIIVPIEPTHSWNEVREYARSVAEEVAAESGKEATASPHGAARRNKVYIDWLRNDKGATTVAAWSTRARSDATVSVPVEWDDLENVRPDQFDVHTAPAQPNVWSEIGTISQTLSNLFF
jgi:bifunctional non-homologous end joining protein LigD